MKSKAISLSILPLLALLIALLSGCERERAPRAAEGGKTPAAQEGASRAEPGVDAFTIAWTDGLARLDSRLAHLEILVRRPQSATLDRIREAFRDARLEYKRMEFAWEYAFPREVTRLNGPAVDLVENDCEHTIVPAHGFQVIEEGIFPELKKDLLETGHEIADLRVALGDGRFRDLVLSDSSLIDAARLELFRIGSLGLAGFDSPAANLSLDECRAALEGLSQALEGRFGTLPFKTRTDSAIAWLAAQNAFQDFDRIAFLKQRLDPLYRALADWQDSLGIPLPSEPRAFQPGARSLFAADAWNPSYFAPSFGADGGEAQANLGRRLFFDPALSGNGNRSCASCHRPELAYTDGLPKSKAMDGHGTVARNAPTLLHAGLIRGSFWDLRAESLEDQADMVIHNRQEMGGPLDSIVGKLQSVPEYAALFRAAFSGDPAGIDESAPVNALGVRRALGAFIRSLSPMQSPWDRHLRGDSAALTGEQIHGFNLFMGKAKCATCHFPPLFNGAVPPLYFETDLEVLGVTRTPDFRRPTLDPDSGRAGFNKVDLSLGAFRTPTVRNVAFTAPYMHNGAFSTLEEVVEFYDRGGGLGLGLEVPNQTLPGDPLGLTPKEKKALVAFMKSLSDTVGTVHRPQMRLVTNY